MNSDVKMCVISWEDAHGQATDAWEELEHAVKEGEDAKVVNSTGFVIAENKRFITLVMNYTDDKTINGRMTIPKGWIKSISYLERVNEPTNT